MSKKRVGLSDVLEVIPKVLQIFLNFCLVLLALILSFLLIKELTIFVKMLMVEGSNDYKQFLANILIFFLYFEFITMIVKYFKEDYHFPLRYFLYVGITAMIRLIIVEHDHPIDTLLYSLVILILIIGYFIMNVTPLERPNRHWFFKNTEEIKRGTLPS
ncbi:phosphate-starvation-inducible protein PsiE [Psychrobacillus sp. FJAT-21963]|uniref:phosphate-starvation-inducible protein PsiE n=1 Tax=unclassified Psychrobacillus TaxID=2636677 RepID=UPI000700BEB0|nr:phosphate-starvation-inducible protein PsiE [Psychrobacillus sp. FJAT-21963]KQL36518.1 phosphate-starvation-inducible protein PsiE [Psychrobacillus sp. FJAT-21963]